MTYKTAKTIKPYAVKFGGYDITIPTGSTVSNVTACGYDDNYRFWSDFDSVTKDRPLLRHDLIYRGINVPKEYCEPWPAKRGGN